MKKAKDTWKDKILPRLKSPVVWTAILSQIVLVVAYFNDYLAGEMKVIGLAIIEILTIFGCLNNPSDRQNF